MTSAAERRRKEEDLVAFGRDVPSATESAAASGAASGPHAPAPAHFSCGSIRTSKPSKLFEPALVTMFTKSSMIGPYSRRPAAMVNRTASCGNGRRGVLGSSAAMLTKNVVVVLPVDVIDDPRCARRAIWWDVSTWPFGVKTTRS